MCKIWRSLAISLAALGSATSAQSQPAWPQKPVRLVIGFAAGTSVDVMSRLLAGPMAEFRHRHRGRDAGAYVIYLNLERFLQPDAFDVDGDFQKIRECFDCVNPTDRMASFRALFDVAEDLVNQNRPSIRRLGRELMGREYIEEDELIDWFATWPAKLNRSTLEIT